MSGRLISVDFQSLHFGGFSFAGAAEPAAPGLAFIAPEEVAATDCVIDLRVLERSARSPPLPGRCASRWMRSSRRRGTSRPGRASLLCCRSGIRAWRAARTLQAQGHVNVALVALGG